MYNKAQDDDLVMNLVDLALSRPPAERESFLSGACTDDVELYDQVLKYVRDEENMHGFMVKPLFSMSQHDQRYRPA